MERMTYRREKDEAVCIHGMTKQNWAEMVQDMSDRLAAYEDTGLEPEEIEEILERGTPLEGGTAELMKEYLSLGSIDHLRDLVQAEKDGLLVVLPCKRGDTVWRICGPKGRKFVEKRIVSSVTIYDPGKFEVFTTSYTSDWLGKTVFLTRKEEAAALKGGTQ